MNNNNDIIKQYRNKPKINGKEFLRVLDKCYEILVRKTYNEQNYCERELSAIIASALTKAYLTKGI